MLPALSSAVSGMRAVTLRLEASAHKIANVNSKGTVQAGGAHTPQVYLLVHVDRASVAPPLSVPSGTTKTALNVSPAWMAAYDAEISSAGGPGTHPGTDLVDAMLEQMSAKNSFIANARAFETAQAMVKRLFELTD